MYLYRAVLLLGVGAAAVYAEALDIKTGLWEVTVTTQSNGMPPVDTSKLTPEQRARLEAMMKERRKPETTVNKNCLTKDDLEQSLFLGKKDDEPSCKKDVVSTARSLSVKEQCNGNQKSTTDVKLDAVSRENVKGTMHMTLGEGARAMTMDSNISAKWVSGSCGDVK
jgi:hypothetical protein